MTIIIIVIDYTEIKLLIIQNSPFLHSKVKMGTLGQQSIFVIEIKVHNLDENTKLFTNINSTG